MVSIMIGLIYFGQNLDQDGVMNINGALFICLTNMTFQNVFAVISVSTYLKCLNVVRSTEMLGENLMTN